MPKQETPLETIPDNSIVDRFTNHALIRCQQRGISHELVDIVYAYGRRSYNKGAEVRFMDKCSRKLAERRLGSEVYRQISDKLDFYIVTSPDGSVLTVAHRNVRLKEKRLRRKNGDRCRSNRELGSPIWDEDPTPRSEPITNSTDAN